MNHLFTLKASIVLFAILFFGAEMSAQSISPADTSNVMAMNIDTNLTKKQSGSILVKSDTALIVKAGATILQKADTTLVINADPELIRQFNEIIAAKQKQVDQVKQDNNVTPVKTDSISKTNTFTQTRTNVPTVNSPDNTAPAPVSLSAPVSAVSNTASSAVTDGAAPAVTNAAKIDAGVPAHINDNPVVSSAPANSNHIVSSTPTNSNQVVGPTPAGNSNSEAAQAGKNDAMQQTTPNTSNAVQQRKSNPASATSNNNGNNTAATETKKVDDAQQSASGNPPATKIDSALTSSNDTIKAKKDTTIKKTDTTAMKKDTSLMVTDTASHDVKAVAAYLEVGGAGLAISGNYDARFHAQRDGWGYRIGVGFFTSGGNTVFTVPFQINYLTGEHSMHIELGAGTTFMNSTGTNVGNSKWEFDKITGFIATGTIGFRYQPEHKGLNFRIAFVPILYDEGIIPAGGVSVGYTFK